MRLDQFISSNLTAVSRSYIQKLIDEKRVFVNGTFQKKSFILKSFDNVEIYMPEPQSIEISPENIPIDVLFEDKDILIVNKEKGMVVHPAPGNYSHTLVNALLYYCKGNLSEINGYIRPGIVHRIDKDTSGILVIAKNNDAHQSLSNQFKEHSICREYRLITFGNIKTPHLCIDQPIGRNPKNRLQMAVVSNGKPAITNLTVIENFKDKTYLKARLETGRTHQIRVHCTYMGNPLLGDSLYTNRKCEYKLEGQTLHAGYLGFIHPTKKEFVEFYSPLPEYFNEILKNETLKLQK